MTDSRPALIVDAHNPGPSGLGRYTRQMVLAMAARNDFRTIYLAGNPDDLAAWVEQGKGAVTPLQIIPFPYSRHSPLVPLRWNAAVASVGPRAVTWFPHWDGAWTARPSVTTLHDLIHLADRSLRGRVRAFVIRQWMTRMIASSHQLISGTQGSADAICKEFPAARAKMNVVHHGVADVFHAAGRNELGAKVQSEPGVPAAGTRYLLTVGNKRPHKRLETAIRAFARLAREDRELRLVMVGPQHAHASTLRALATTLGVAERIDDVSGLSDLALAEVYRRAEALLVPSREEGFGLVVIEGMAAGTPVIVVNVPALVEVAGGAAQVVPLDDDASMANAIRSLDANRWRAAGLARAAEFTWAKAAEKTASLLRGAKGEVEGTRPRS